MQKKTIKQILKKKFNDWIDSIKDDEVRKLVRKNSIITGGAIVSMLLGDEVNDYDIYFTNKETTKVVAQYYIKEFKKTHSSYNIYVLDGIDVTAEQKCNTLTYKYRNMDENRLKIIVEIDNIAEEKSEEDEYDNNGITDRTEFPEQNLEQLLDNADIISAKELEKDEKERYRPVFLSSNAITLSNKIQIIVRFYGTPDKIHENYDFIHCMNYWEAYNNNLVLRQEALESILAKQLIYKGSKYPICSIIRTRKFINRGWHINAGQYLKMCMQISELNLHDISILEDQLVGVDSLYFARLIDSLSKKIEKEENFIITNSYIFSILDKIF
ncbi:MAG: hypothetical protein ACYS76_09720 [Planctomycetota bacterium]|jgi:hypothetical protein